MTYSCNASRVASFRSCRLGNYVVWLDRLTWRELRKKKSAKRSSRGDCTRPDTLAALPELRFRSVVSSNFRLTFGGNFPSLSNVPQASVQDSFSFHNLPRKSNFKGCLLSSLGLEGSLRRIVASRLVWIASIFRITQFHAVRRSLPDGKWGLV